MISVYTDNTDVQTDMCLFAAERGSFMQFGMIWKDSREISVFQRNLAA